MAKRMRSLNVHGITKVNFDELHPLPEKAEETISIPYEVDSQDFYLQLSPENSGSLSSSTDRSLSYTRQFSNGFFSESMSSSMGTGLSESVCSWGIDDEFDEKAANHVLLMFDEVDRCLFENQTDGLFSNEPGELIDECGDWRGAYPYLRVLGTQLLSSEDNGTKLISTSDLSARQSVSLSNHVLKTSKENFMLNINGERVEAVAAPSNTPNKSSTNQPDDSSNLGLSFLQEEIFAIDGDIEEYLAYDNNNIDIKEKKNTTRKKYPSLPPMTPHAFVHETALSECFDHVWSEIIVILENLLLLYTQARAKKDFERAQEPFGRQMDRFLESSLELPHSRDSYGRLQPLSSQLKMKASGIFDSTPSSNPLKELMTIRSVALQQRAPSETPFILPNDDIPLKDNLNGRPMSSVHRQFPKTTNFRYAEQQFYERMLSAKTPKRTLRLQPLPPKTAGQIENIKVGEVRGTRLQKVGGVPNINPIWAPRNIALPPLERLTTGDTTVSVRDIQFHKPSKRNSRVSSAVSNDSKVLPTRERASFQPLPDSRPYTTHLSTRTELAFNPKTFQSSKFRDIPNGTLSKFHDIPNASSKSFLHSHLLPENMYHFPTHMKHVSVASVDEEAEVDDFILFGHGPPLLPPQQRKGKLTASNIR